MDPKDDEKRRAVVVAELDQTAAQVPSGAMQNYFLVCYAVFSLVHFPAMPSNHFFHSGTARANVPRWVASGPAETASTFMSPAPMACW